VLGRAFIDEPMIQWPLGGAGDVATVTTMFSTLYETPRDRYGPLTPDGGARYGALWSWVESHLPSEPLWYLDALAVDPSRQAKGIGGALLRFGLELGERDGTGAFLETSRERNVGYYERFGFRVVDEGDAPGGGPHIWFMRR